MQAQLVDFGPKSNGENAMYTTVLTQKLKLNRLCITYYLERVGHYVGFTIFLWIINFLREKLLLNSK